VSAHIAGIPAGEFLQLQARAMTEAQLQTQVLAMARFHGFTLTYHTYDSRRSDAGFPDLVMVNPRQKRVLFRELKREKGSITSKQQTWIDTLTAAGQDAAIWKPSHLFSGEIEASLRGPRQ
jgi:hypothetical protein